MQNRYRMYRRGRGSFYVKDRVTGKAESLGTADRAQAQHFLAARNQAVIQPQLNRAMARTYLMAKSPELVTRTWAEVMDHYVQGGVESTRELKERAFASRPFAKIDAAIASTIERKAKALPAGWLQPKSVHAAYRSGSKVR